MVRWGVIGVAACAIALCAAPACADTWTFGPSGGPLIGTKTPIERLPADTDYTGLRASFTSSTNEFIAADVDGWGFGQSPDVQGGVLMGDFWGTDEQDLLIAIDRVRPFTQMDVVVPAPGTLHVNQFPYPVADRYNEGWPVVPVRLSTRPGDAIFVTFAPDADGGSTGFAIDNIRSVPEPGALTVLIGAAVPIARMLRRSCGRHIRGANGVPARCPVGWREQRRRSAKPG